MAKETPVIWLLRPPSPRTAETEQALLKTEWSAQQAWWLQWLWWFFCWWNRSHFTRLLTEQPSDTDVDFLPELNRLLSGDARCKVYEIGSSELDTAFKQLAPKSTVHLFPLSAFPSSFELQQIDLLQASLKDNKHQGVEIPRPIDSNEWLEVISLWVRRSLVELDLKAPLKHIVFVVRRSLDNWKNLHTQTEKSCFMQQQLLKECFPSCSVHFVVNGPAAQSTLERFPPDEPILYGFIDGLYGQQDALHPTLQHPNLHSMVDISDSILLLRLLRQQIWDATGTAP